MGNGLSQNEIDALLAGADETVLTSGNEEGDANQFQSSEEQSKRGMEEVNDFINEALASSLNTLSKITESEVNYSKIKSALKDSARILNTFKGKVVTITQTVKGGINGAITFILEEQGALKLIEKMLAQEETVLSDISLSTLGENFMKFLAAMYNWMENTYKKNVEGDIPKVNVINNAVDIELPSKQSVEVSYFLKLDDESIPVVLALPVTVSKEIINLTIKGAVENGHVEDTTMLEKESTKQVNTRPIQFSRLDEDSGKLPLGNIEILLDVSMQVTVELGRTKMRIREILGLGEGSIIELQKLAGEPVDILVNGKLIAKGEVVVIDEYFGVRITEIISPAEMMDIMSVREED